MVTSVKTELVRVCFSVDHHPLHLGAAVPTLSHGQRVSLFFPSCACGRSHWSAGVNLARIHRLAEPVKLAIRALSDPPSYRMFIRLAGVRGGEAQMGALRAELFGVRGLSVRVA